jgi:hypothetical protein
MYSEIFKGEFPKNLKSIPVTSKTKERFTDALIGWLGYAPLLIFMTSQDEREKEDRLKNISSKIGEPTRKLAEILNYPRLEKCEEVFNCYYNSLEKDFSDLRMAQESWRKILEEKFKN